MKHCKTCRFYVRFKMCPWAECRRHAPVSGEDVVYDGEGNQGWRRWPETLPDDGCGDHEPRNAGMRDKQIQDAPPKCPTCRCDIGTVAAPHWKYEAACPDGCWRGPPEATQNEALEAFRRWTRQDEIEGERYV